MWGEALSFRDRENSDFLDGVRSVLPAPTWDIVKGKGRTRPERTADKSALVTLALLMRLDGDDAWRAYVTRARDGESAAELAKAYGNGPKRRAVMAVLLDHAACGRRFAVAYTVDEEAAGTGGNHYSPWFWDKVATGCEGIARLGAQQCLKCGDHLPHARLESSGRSAR